MIYNAKVLKLGKYVDEEVLLQVEEYNVLCFAAFCPEEIFVDKTYRVRLELQVFDDYKINECASSKEHFEQIDNSFRHIIRGKLEGACLDAGLVFEDNMFCDLFTFQGKNVAIEVDRIDVEFL